MVLTKTSKNIKQNKITKKKNKFSKKIKKHNKGKDVKKNRTFKKKNSAFSTSSKSVLHKFKSLIQGGGLKEERMIYRFYLQESYFHGVFFSEVDKNLIDNGYENDNGYRFAHEVISEIMGGKNKRQIDFFSISVYSLIKTIHFHHMTISSKANDMKYGGGSGILSTVLNSSSRDVKLRNFGKEIVFHLFFIVFCMFGLYSCYDNIDQFIRTTLIGHDELSFNYASFEGVLLHTFLNHLQRISCQKIILNHDF